MFPPRFIRQSIRWAGAAIMLAQPLSAFALFGPLPKGSGLPEGNLIDLIGRLIGTALEIIGIFFIGLMLYAGLLWMTAQGDAEKVTKARDIIVQATIGIVVIALSYSISFYVTDQLGVALGAGVGKTGQTP